MKKSMKCYYCKGNYNINAERKRKDGGNQYNNWIKFKIKMQHMLQGSLALLAN